MPQDSTDALPRRRWWLTPLIVLGVLLLLLAGGFFAYRWTEPGRLVKQARAHLEKEDFPSAAIALRRAIMISPRHPEAVRLMAELADRLHAVSAIGWREQLLDLDPNSLADRTALVGSALRLRRMDAAEEALRDAPAAFRATAQYEALRGLVAIGQGRWKEAEEAFAEAVRRDPARPGYRYNLGVAQLQSPDANVRAAGIEKLTSLAADPTYATPAKRSLLRFHLREKNFADALRLSTEITASKEVLFADLLVHLDLLRQAQRTADFTATMERARSLAINSPPDLGALFRWSVSNGATADTRAWADSLDAKLREHPAVIEPYAELLAAGNDWATLESLASRKLPWTRGEAMRHAFAALAADKLGRSEVAGTLWQVAVESGAPSKEGAMNLAYFAHRAGWRAKMIEVLWAATAGDDPEWALRTLHRLCVEDNNTAGLLRVARRLQAIKPDDQGAQNNVIILSLLLNEPAAPLLDAARSLHSTAPANATFASTYAFALHKAGQTSQGLQVLQQLPPAELARPEVALYHAVLLSAEGKTREAAEAAAHARRGKLLPEEETLLNTVPGA